MKVTYKSTSDMKSIAENSIIFNKWHNQGSQDNFRVASNTRNYRVDFFNNMTTPYVYPSYDTSSPVYLSGYSDGIYYEFGTPNADIIAFDSYGNFRISMIDNADMSIVFYTDTTHLSNVWKSFFITENKIVNRNTSDIISNYISSKKTLGGSTPTEYIAQPIIINGTETQVYSIVSRTTTASPDIYSEVVIGGVRFLMVAGYIGVKI